MLLALFLIELAAGLYLFLPLVGRRTAGVKFYRLILLINAVLALAALTAHLLAHARRCAALDGAAFVLTILVYAMMRYPKRLVFRVPAGLLAATWLLVAVVSFQDAVHATLGWSIAGALSAIALLGSVNLAMLLGHWYLVVRGMPIEPLARLTTATLFAAIVKTIVIAIALIMTARDGTGYGTQLYRICVGQGIFFWMRAGWGLVGPLMLYPMVRGTVKLRSTMAATGILYVDVVAVVIGEVLGGYLSSLEHISL